MDRKLLALGFALALLLILPGSAAAAKVADAGQEPLWQAIFQGSTPASCEIPLMSPAAPALSLASSAEEELSYCWCCAKTGHPDCCNPCFQEEAVDR